MAAKHAQQIDRARHHQRRDRTGGAAIEVDPQHLVLVIHFRERERQGAAAVAQMFLLADALGKVQVAEGGVGDGGVEDPG
ncbi:hypothetical protein LP420_34650 [Massilia sp. B-10]|nr:hypothetical protein LP420_34650 [Massilia sp. B-10]